ncbi:SdpI family protein [Devosia sp. 63-57]|uniref:SdpI family protein n=1 Tax=Devosia sp. 63-57 TaxID=1895751 RepID=UPI00086BC07F|nr:SdpI family protein [Devosia sp. 63-57]ODT49161.1 MAG: hypothetical protein ABS74_09525 [Pelagibacterium sp. SCN 63-126]ODU86052.1 MAG: hypothetical protein ABT14_10485 [Pelagibacterium sp. SCN 63-17]OJX43321.1 MAG: hypothetical protein BGO80_18245 [Devosia sp. 63-57]
MQNLVTRFHALILTVTVAMAAVGFLHIPANYAFPAHWQGSIPDWLWPRDVALVVAPLVQIVLMAGFFVLGRALTKNHFAKVQHILDPALTLALAVAAACQLGLLVMGNGSDLDLIRFTGLALAGALLVLGLVLFEAERHTYAGMRMPWPIASDRGWRIVHRVAGLTSGLLAFALAALVWIDPGPGPMVIALATSLLTLPVIAALATLITLITRRL